jgi:hypothetical protein
MPFLRSVEVTHFGWHYQPKLVLPIILGTSALVKPGRVLFGGQNMSLAISKEEDAEVQVWKGLKTILAGLSLL